MTGTLPSPLVLVSGEPGSGKTALCMAVAARLRRANLRPGGIVCPGRYRGSRQIGKWVTNVTTGESRLLAHRLGQGEAPGPYLLRPEALDWGNRTVLDAVGRADVVLIDEAGPEELVRGGGWLTGLEAGLAQGVALLVVVRPGLLDVLQERAATVRGVDAGASCEIVYADADRISELAGKVVRHLGGKRE